MNTAAVEMSLITAPTTLPLIAPSILSADFANLGQECKAVLEGGADFLHLDVMDGHFVPNLTMGGALCVSLRKALPKTYLDVHLMVTHPMSFIESFANAGANLFTGHIESSDDPLEMARAIHDAGMDAGLAINPPTDVEEILPYIEDYDLIYYECQSGIFWSSIYSRSFRKSYINLRTPSPVPATSNGWRHWSNDSAICKRSGL